MSGLYPIIRRVRRPYVELDPPAVAADPAPGAGLPTPPAVAAPADGGSGHAATMPVAMKGEKDSNHAKLRKGTAPRPA